MRVPKVNGLEFIASMTSALAWPTVGLTAVVLLRKPLADLLRTKGLKRVKAGPVEIEWSEALEDARANLGQGAPYEYELDKFTTRQGPGFDANEFREEMASLAAVDPAAAVLASFTRLERMLRQKVDVSITDRPRPRVATRELGQLASQQGLWSDNELAAFRDLIPLRNLAAHGEDVVNLDESRAYEFAELALQLMIALLLGSGETDSPQD